MLSETPHNCYTELLRVVLHDGISRCQDLSRSDLNPVSTFLEAALGDKFSAFSLSSLKAPLVVFTCVPVF